MKLFIIISALCAIAVATPGSGNHEYLKTHKQCMKEAGADYSIKEDPKAKCVTNCVYTKFKVFTADGHLNETAYGTDIRKPVKDCFETHKKLEPCERANMFYKCTKKVIEDIWDARIKKCAAETKTTVSVKNEEEMWKEIAHEKKSCFARCMLVHMELLDKEHKLNMDKINLYAAGNNALNVEEIIENCNKEHVSDDSCTQIAKRALCVLYKIPEKKDKKQ